MCEDECVKVQGCVRVGLSLPFYQPCPCVCYLCAQEDCHEHGRLWSSILTGIYRPKGMNSIS